MSSARLTDEVDDAGKQSLSLSKHLFQQMVNQSEHCDVTITAGDKEQKAHWCVLVMFPYFEALYNSGMREKQEGKVHISISSGNTMVDVVYYMYAGRITLNDGNINDVLQLSDYLQIDSLTQVCEKFLENVTISNCTRNLLLAKTYRLNVFNTLISFLFAHIPEVINRTDSTQLPIDVLKQLVTDLTLSYVPRSRLFQFLVRWLAHEPQVRGRHFKTIFSDLDLLKFSRRYIEDEMMTCKYVQNCVSCVKQCKQALSRLRTPRTDCRTDAIVLVGGVNETKISSKYVFAYIIKEQCWIELDDVPGPLKTKHLLVSGNESIHLFHNIDREILSTEYVKHWQYSFVDTHWWPDSFKDAKNVPEDLIITEIKAVLHAQITKKCCFVGLCKRRNNNQLWVCLCLIGDKGETTLPFQLICPASAPKTTRACVAEGRYVCIVTRCRKERQSMLKLYLIDTDIDATLNIQEYSTESSFLSLVYYNCFAMENKVCVCRDIFWDDFIVFDTNTRTWTVIKSKLFKVPKLLHYSFVAVGSKLYVFGGKVASRFQKSTYMLDFETGKCVPLPPKPVLLSNSQAFYVRIPLNSCHKECPHCKYRPIPTQ